MFAIDAAVGLLVDTFATVDATPKKLLTPSG
jgi:hypothetical protein